MTSTDRTPDVAAGAAPEPDVAAGAAPEPNPHATAEQVEAARHDSKLAQVLYHDWEAETYDDKWSISYDQRCIDYARGRFDAIVPDEVQRDREGRNAELFRVREAVRIPVGADRDNARGKFGVIGCLEQGTDIGSATRDENDQREHATSLTACREQADDRGNTELQRRQQTHRERVRSGMLQPPRADRAGRRPRKQAENCAANDPDAEPRAEQPGQCSGGTNPRTERRSK